MRCGFIVPHGKQAAFVAPIVDGFEANGLTVRCFEPDDHWDFNGMAMIVTYGPMYPISKIIEKLQHLNNPPPLIFWYTEQTPSPRLPIPLTQCLAQCRFALQQTIDRAKPMHASLISRLLQRVSGRAGRFRAIGELHRLQQISAHKLVCTFSDTNRKALDAVGLPCITLPIGYHKSFGQRLDIPRDIDVVFLGSTRDRRRGKIIERLEKRLSNRGIQFIIKDGSPERGYIFGIERTILLNRTKIVLSIMRQPWDDPVHRLIMAGSCGAMLLSEPVMESSFGPFMPGEHFAVARLEELPDTIEYYLHNAPERQRLADQAHEFIMTDLPTEKMVGQALATMTSQGLI